MRQVSRPEFLFTPPPRQGPIVLPDEHNQVFSNTVRHLDRIHDAAGRFVVTAQIVDLARQIVFDRVSDARYRNSASSVRSK
jgi:hypothetical protein